MFLARLITVDPDLIEGFDALLVRLEASTARIRSCLPVQVTAPDPFMQAALLHVEEEFATDEEYEDFFGLMLHVGQNLKPGDVLIDRVGHAAQLALFIYDTIRSVAGQ
jgi:hypothetical protein